MVIVIDQAHLPLDHIFVVPWHVVTIQLTYPTI